MSCCRSRSVPTTSPECRSAAAVRRRARVPGSPSQAEEFNSRSIRTNAGRPCSLRDKWFSMAASYRSMRGAACGLSRARRNAASSCA